MTEFSLKYEILEKSGTPINENHLSYWGPIDHQFSDSFLSMSNIFLQKYFENQPISKIKGIFTAFVELVQNVAEYNEKNKESLFKHSFVNLSIENNYASILTSNQILSEDLETIRSHFNELFSLNHTQLNEMHKNAILNNESLGLLMVRRLKESEFFWELNKDSSNNNWLNIKLKVHYGDSSH